MWSLKDSELEELDRLWRMFADGREMELSRDDIRWLFCKVYAMRSEILELREVLQIVKAHVVDALTEYEDKSKDSNEITICSLCPCENGEETCTGAHCLDAAAELRRQRSE